MMSEIKMQGVHHSMPMSWKGIQMREHCGGWSPISPTIIRPKIRGLGKVREAASTRQVVVYGQTGKLVSE